MRLRNQYSWSIVGFSTAWLAGLWLGHLGWYANISLAVVAIVVCMVAWRSRLLIIAMLTIGLALGIFYGHQSLSRYQVINNLIGRSVSFNGTVKDDPATNEKGTTTFLLGSLTLQNQSVPGALTVKTYSAKYQRGYKVQVTGKLYSVLGSRQAGVYGSVVIISRTQTGLEKLRQRFIASINSTVPDPLNSFALGLLMGARSLIPKNLQNQLAIVGLSHLVAVSGYNLTIIVQTVRRLLTRTSRFVALTINLWLIGGFVVVAGTSASIVRAAVVSVFALITYYYGRKIKPWVLVAVPAVLTTLWKPEYLWSDVGWQLSFLAFIGILVVAPMIEKRLKRPTWVKKIIVEAFCAQLLTFPIILSVFHQFSVVGVLANVLVLPLVPLAMLASFVAGVINLLTPAFGWASLPAYIVLKVMLGVVELLASLNWASISLKVSFATILLLYAAIVIAAVAFSRRKPTASAAGDIILKETLNEQVTR